MSCQDRPPDNEIRWAVDQIEECPRLALRMACKECGYPPGEAYYMITDSQVPHRESK